jgi:hypothetical protein
MTGSEVMAEVVVLAVAVEVVVKEQVRVGQA